MSLATELVDAIWDKLAIAYGHRFLSVWEGLPQELVKADWAERLDGVPEQKIEWALGNLPAGKPPDAMEFRQLCGRMPEYQRQRSITHEAPTVVPPGVRELVQQFKGEQSTEPFRVRWARAYVRQFGGAGLKLRFAQRQDLERAHRIIREHEVETGLADAKKQTQDRVDAALHHENPDGEH